MYMAEGLDTGDMLEKAEVPDRRKTTISEPVFGRLAVCGAELLLRTLPHIFDGSAKPEKQDGSLATYAKKIEKADWRP